MKNRRVRLVDTTLRDGSHAVRHSFDTKQVAKIAKGLDKSGVEIIEVSHGDGLGGEHLLYRRKGVGARLQLSHSRDRGPQNQDYNQKLLHGVIFFTILHSAFPVLNIPQSSMPRMSLILLAARSPNVRAALS